jgi:uncharacterized protein YdeI (YjbR/CyaY-like superfamily)
MAEIDRITATDGDELRQWLADHHDTADAVWLVYYKKGSGRPSIDWPEAVDQALCFGWIDSKVRSLDDERYEQYFSRRKPGSPWSRINKDKVAELTAAGLMEPAGQEAIDRAQADGSWSMLDEVEAGVVPDDLAAALDASGGLAAFDGFTDAQRRGLLAWVLFAKRADTRARRIAQIAAAAAEGRRPAPY